MDDTIEYPAGAYTTFLIRNVQTGEYLVQGHWSGDYWTADMFRATEYDTADAAAAILLPGEEVYSWS